MFNTRSIKYQTHIGKGKRLQIYVTFIPGIVPEVSALIFYRLYEKSKFNPYIQFRTNLKPGMEDVKVDLINNDITYKSRLDFSVEAYTIAVLNVKTRKFSNHSGIVPT